MSKLPFVLPLTFLLIVAASMLACGSNHGNLQAITISPASADAQNYPNGQVQFTAAGTYADGHKVTPLPVMWTGPDQPWFNPPPVPIAIWIDSHGVAVCPPSAPTGPYTVWAVAPIDPHLPLSQMMQSTPQVTATAQVICP